MEIIRRSRAIKEGLVRYFSGSVCVNNHIAERYTSNGSCVECHRITAQKIRDAYMEARDARQNLPRSDR